MASVTLATKQEIAHALLAEKAVFLNPSHPFTWASGIISPIYCDNRLTLSYPAKDITKCIFIQKQNAF